MDREEAFRRALPLEPGCTALLIVDMQRAFVEAGQAMEVPSAREIVPRIQELLAIFREKHLPVVFTEFTYSPAAPLLVGELHRSTAAPLPARRPASGGRLLRASRARTMPASSPSSRPAPTSWWCTSTIMMVSTGPSSMVHFGHVAFALL